MNYIDWFSYFKPVLHSWDKPCLYMIYYPFYILLGLTCHSLFTTQHMYSCMRLVFGLVLSCVRFFVTPWTVAHQAPLSMGFSRQDYWSGLPFPSPGDLPSPGVKPISLVSPALEGGFFTTGGTWEVLLVCSFLILSLSGFGIKYWLHGMS